MPISPANLSIIENVAAALGGKFEYTENFPVAYVELGWVKLSFRVIDEKDGERFTISYSAPKDGKGRVHSISDLSREEQADFVTAITCAARTSEVVAKQIERRLLPGLKPLMGELEARIKRANDFAQLTKDNADRMSKLLGVEASKNCSGDEPSFFPKSDDVPGLYKVRVHGNYVTLESYTLDIEVALKLIAAWQKIK